MSIKLPKTTMIAPVGWYRERLWSSIYHTGPDRIYFIVGKDGAVRGITEEISDKLSERLPAIEPKMDAADFHDYRDVFRVFTKIIEHERKKDPDALLIIDVTSSTKDGVIATSLLSQLYNIQVTYVPPKEKLKWIDPSKTAAELLLQEPFKSEASDPGAGFFVYPLRANGLESNNILALETAYDSKKVPMKNLVEDLKKRKRDLSRRYWVRQYDKLETLMLVEIDRNSRELNVSVSEIGAALVEGIKESKTLKD